MNATPCSVCGEGGHGARKCPTLSSPLEPGFYKGQIPRGGGGDEEDDSLRVGNLPVRILFHARNLCGSHKPVVMKKKEL